MEGPARSAWQLYLGPCGIRTRCPRSPCLEAALVQPPAESRSSPPTEARVREKWLEELSRQRERYQRTGQRGRCERSDDEQTDFFQSSTLGTNIMFFVWRSSGPSNFVGRVWLTVVVVACHLTSQCSSPRFHDGCCGERREDVWRQAGCLRQRSWICHSWRPPICGKSDARCEGSGRLLHVRHPDELFQRSGLIRGANGFGGRVQRVELRLKQGGWVSEPSRLR